MSIDDFTNGDGCRQKEVTGRMVLFCLVAFFAVVAAVNGILIRAAVSTFSGLETASSYEAGLAFEQEVAAAEAQDALHWQIQGKLTRAGSGATDVEISARDADGRVLAGLAASAVLVHPTDRRLDRGLVMNEDAPGHFNGTASPSGGQWDLVIELTRAGARVFRSKNRVVLR